MLIECMKKKFLILFLALIASTCLYSQNTLTITSEQLKTTNLIFAEHKKLVQTVPLLEEQITNLNEINRSWERTDSIRKLQIDYCMKQIDERNKSIDGLTKSLSRKKKYITYSSTCCLALLVCLLLK